MRFSLVINSNSKNLICLKIFFKQLEKFVNIRIFNKIYLLIDRTPDYIPPEYIITINYHQKDCFKKQIVSCLQKINDEIILYVNEDYLIYSHVNENKLLNLVSLLESSYFNFIKLVHSDLEIYSKWSSELFLIHCLSQNNFSQTTTIWKTRDLLNIYLITPDSGIGENGMIIGHAEELAKISCKRLGIQGLCYYNGEKKRGLCHYDSDIIPHIASALIKGQWNTKEYPELIEILKENNIHG